MTVQYHRKYSEELKRAYGRLIGDSSLMPLLEMGATKYQRKMVAHGRMWYADFWSAQMVLACMQAKRRGIATPALTAFRLTLLTLD